jgi:hypothetical protein
LGKSRASDAGLPLVLLKTLQYMAQFASIYKDLEFTQQPVAQLFT